MGACGSTNNNKTKQTFRRNHTNGKDTNIALQGANLDSSVGELVQDEGQSPVFKYIKEANIKKLTEMIRNNELDVNAYCFGGNKTALHVAILKTNSPALVEFLLMNNAKVDAVEKETGNTPIFLAAFDLKVDILSILLQYRPNIGHQNYNKEDIFTFLKENMKPEKNARTVKRSQLTPEEEDNYRRIMDMLNDYKEKNQSIQDLDQDDQVR